MVKKLILIGCGNIGSRHLQSLMKFQNKISIDIVEPNKKSKNNAIELIKKLSIKKSPKINWFTSIRDLSNSGDVVIVATNSIGRHKLIDTLLKQGNKKFLIEKMVCQSKEEYKFLISAFKKYNANGWINVNRRYFISYQKIKELFLSSKFLELNVHLGNSGLGASSIHFIDLFCWLNDNYNIKLNGKYLFDKIHPSKRGKQFKEFAGTIVGSNKNSSFLTISTNNNQSIPPSIIVEIYDGEKHIIINELEEKIYFLTNFENISKFSFKFGHVSELSYKIIQDILKNNSCLLPTLQDSYDSHSELFRIFNKHLSKQLHHKVEKCPIT